MNVAARQRRCGVACSREINYKERVKVLKIIIVTTNWLQLCATHYPSKVATNNKNVNNALIVLLKLLFSARNTTHEHKILFSDFCLPLFEIRQ